MEVHSELLEHRFELPERPDRVVCLTSGTTEALFSMGLGHRVVGVSSFCARYVPELDQPVVGDYMRVDEPLMARARPDLILVTTGVQRALGQKLASRGLPVYALPLPSSFHGVLENIVTTAALMGEVSPGRRLCDALARRAAELRAQAATRRPRVYVELWFGKHARSIGGRSFIHDIVEIAGGDPLFSDSPQSYLELPLDEVAEERPDVIIGFSEPVYPVDFDALIAQRGWDAFAPRLVLSSVEKGRNMIHDGPSMIDTAAWLQAELRRVLAED
jgi:ABC-type Fe3+-hydroxamate transport system substrate-binding protein